MELYGKKHIQKEEERTTHKKINAVEPIFVYFFAPINETDVVYILTLSPEMVLVFIFDTCFTDECVRLDCY